MPINPLIMIVEDDTDLANNIAQAVRNSKKYEVVIAGSSADAFKQISKNEIFMGGNLIRLILLDVKLDVKMPEMDSFQFLAKLRQDFPPEKMGVIIITAFEDLQILSKVRDGSAAAFIKKPFELTHLISTIDRFFTGKSKWMIEQTKWETLDQEQSLTGGPEVPPASSPR